MTSESGQKISQIEYYRFRMLSQVDFTDATAGNINRFDMLGRLCNEYLVDMYSRVEDERLNFIRFNQSRVAKRGELEAVVDETVHGEGPAHG